MAIVVRYECHGCGAPAQPRGTAWVRCDHCQILVGFDWQGFLDSPAYAALLRNSASQLGRWNEYTALMAEAARAAGAGRDEEALALYTRLGEMILELTPHAFPDQARTDPACRRRHLEFFAFQQLMNVRDPVCASLQGRLTGLLQNMKLTEPLEVLLPAAEIFEQQIVRLGRIPGAPLDPDGMPAHQRTKATLSVFLGGYLHLLDDAARLSLLRRIHGSSNVRIVGAGEDDGLGLYLDWTCPRCSLASMQARTVTEYTCPGCFCRRPVRSGRAQLESVELACPTCGARVTVGEGQSEALCGYCKIAVRRLARTGDVERTFAEEIRARYGGEPLPPAGVDGLAVTPDNRAELVLIGLARQAVWYANLVNGERFAKVVRASLPDEQTRALGLDRVLELALGEGGGQASEKLLGDTASALQLRRWRSDV